LTTEYADGENLDILLHRTGQFPVRRALRVLAQLADAVDHAHARGVIHRDLKPANIILVERRGHLDTVKVLDFGIAKIIAPDYKETMATADGLVLGTPAYMAPEQVSGQGRDPRIDIYALGCIAHELVTGDPPFTGKTVEIMNGHLAKPPQRPSARRREAGIPVELDEVILRCLEKDPDLRFQSGRDVLAALRAVPGFPAAERHSSGRRRPAELPTRDHSQARVDDFRPDTDTRGFNAMAVAETMFGNADDSSLGSAPEVQEVLTVESVRLQFEDALQRLAEALIDNGCHDPMLTATSAQIAAARSSLDSIVARMDDKERSGSEAEQRGRENEARLRFAIGELRFDIEEARVTRAHLAPDIEAQLAQLEQRLARLHAEIEREQAAITERAIALAADKHEREQELSELYTSLASLVELHAPRFAGLTSVRELGQRLSRARAILSRQGYKQTP